MRSKDESAACAALIADCAGESHFWLAGRGILRAPRLLAGPTAATGQPKAGRSAIRSTNLSG
jgi:hypothetical protein